MRILILDQWYPPEPQKLVSDLAQTLQTFGHQVTVMTGFPNWPAGKLYPGYRLKLWQKEELDGVPLIRLPLFPDHSHSSVRRVLNFVSFVASTTILGPWLAPQVDVIHVINPITLGWPAWILSCLQNIPFTYEIQDMWPETLRATGMLNNEKALEMVGKFAKWVYRRAARIRVISPGFRDNLILKGVPPEKIRVISNWVDTDFFRPVEPDSELARKLGLDRHFNIMFAGTIGLAQGLDTLLEAAALLHDLGEVQFVLVGDGADLPRLQKMAGDRNLSNVKFLGRRPENFMPDFYALADAMFLHLRDDPLFKITMPHKIFTYMASGKPILAAMEGDTANVVRSAEAGVICPPGNPVALADTIRKFYQLSSADRLRMGKKGRQVACEQYGREYLIGQFAMMIDEVVTPNQPSGISYNRPA